MTNFTHIPVLLNESIVALDVQKGKKYIDATLGGGGHTKEILNRGGLVLGIDQDQDALEFVAENQASYIKDKALTINKGNFRNLAKIAQGQGFGEVDGILIDLGVSSYQLDASGRGFSIRRDEKLDMRMNKGNGISAYDVVNEYGYEKLVDIFYRYGEEHNAKGIAQGIIDKRRKKQIETTKELADIIERVPHRSEDIHPATRVFQAIRIEVNDEIEALKEVLSQGVELLGPGGKIAVISFHSLEDRIVKQSFLKSEREKKGVVMTKKPIVSSEDEIKINRRSRSARLRIFKKN